MSASPLLSARSYPTIDSQCLSHPSTSINAIKAHSKEANISQASLLQTEMGIEPQQLEEPEPTLEDEYQDLHLNLPFLEVLAHALIYNAILDKYDKPPKDGDGAWHAKIRIIDPDGEEFTKTLQSIPTTRKLSERESPREIINLDHFYDI
ncbi:hypothetical protein Tco_0183895 [Tanacetum coccineum]